MTYIFQTKLKKIVTAILFTIIFTFVASETARAETIFSFELDGSQAGTNSTATGFAGVFLSDAENVAYVVVKMNGLSGVPNVNSGVSIRDENGTLLRYIPMHSQTLTKSISYFPTAQEVAKMKQGKIKISVVTPNYPGGEISGSGRPYSGFVGRLRGSNSNPPGDPNAYGFVGVMLNKQETDGILFYSYGGLPSVSCSVQFGTFVSQTSSINTSGWYIEVLSHLSLANGNFISGIKSGRHTLMINRNSQPVVRGFPKPINKDVDFDGDGRADKTVFRPNNGTWYWLRGVNNSESTSFQLGSSASIPVPADFDGDGITDYAVWLPSNGYFYTWNVHTNVFKGAQWGKSGDVPVPADYDGDGKADFAIYRPGVNNSQSYFWVLKSTGGHYSIPFGLGNDQAILADFDGDRINDITVWRPSNGTFYSYLSGDGSYRTQQFGISTDTPAAADFDGDGKDDYVAFRNTGADAGVWYVLGSSSGFSAYRYGLPDDDIQPADYDSDGKADYAVFRNGRWYVAGSISGFTFTFFGTTGDKAVTGR